MAAKKKRKAGAKKTKKKSKAAKKRTTAARRPARKKVAPKKAKVKAKAKPRRRPAAKGQRPGATRRRPAPVPVVSTPTPPPGERIGVVTHYYTHLSVAIIQLESGALREGDTVHIKGHTSDFRQRVESMEVDHVQVAEVRVGQSFGLRVKEHAREHDVVYKVTSP